MVSQHWRNGFSDMGKLVAPDVCNPRPYPPLEGHEHMFFTLPRHLPAHHGVRGTAPHPALGIRSPGSRTAAGPAAEAGDHRHSPGERLRPQHVFAAREWGTRRGRLDRVHSPQRDLGRHPAGLPYDHCRHGERQRRPEDRHGICQHEHWQRRLHPEVWRRHRHQRLLEGKVLFPSPCERRHPKPAGGKLADSRKLVRRRLGRRQLGPGPGIHRGRRRSQAALFRRRLHRGEVHLDR